MQRTPVARKAAPPPLRTKYSSSRHCVSFVSSSTLWSVSPAAREVFRVVLLRPSTGCPASVTASVVSTGAGLPNGRGGERPARTRSGSGNHILPTGVKNAASSNASQGKRGRSVGGPNLRTRLANASPRHYPLGKATQRTRRCTLTEDIVHDDPATSARTLLAESLLRHEVVRSFHSDAHIGNVRTFWKFDPFPQFRLGLYLHT